MGWWKICSERVNGRRQTDCQSRCQLQFLQERSLWLGMHSNLVCIVSWKFEEVQSSAKSSQTILRAKNEFFCSENIFWGVRHLNVRFGSSSEKGGSNASLPMTLWPDFRRYTTRRNASGGGTAGCGKGFNLVHPTCFFFEGWGWVSRIHKAFCIRRLTHALWANLLTSSSIDYVLYLPHVTWVTVTHKWY